MSDDRDVQNTDQGTPPPAVNVDVNTDGAPVVGTQPPVQGMPTQGGTIAPQQPVQGQGGPQAPNAAAGTAPAPNPHAGLWSSIKHVLGGNNITYKPNAETGEIEKVVTPVSSGREMANSIVASALTGLFAGSQVRGPGGALRGFGAGGQVNMERLQQDDKDARNQAVADLGRKASVAEANMKMLGNAVALGRMGKEDHDSITGSYADQLNDIKENSPDLIGDREHVSEADAKDLNKYPVSDYVRIPDGVVPRVDPNTGQQVKINGVAQWDNTYSLVQNGKVGIADDDGAPKTWVKDAVDWGIPGYSASLLKPGQGAQISVASAAKAQHTVAQLNMLQTELNNYTSSFGKGKDGKPSLAPIDLKAVVKKDPSMFAAIQHFQRAAGMSTQPDRQLDAMRQDPKNAPYAAKIMSLFGADNLETYKSSRESTQAAEKQAAEKRNKAAVVATDDDAKFVLAHPNDYSADQIKSAHDFLTGSVNQAGDKAYAEAQARAQAEAEQNEKQNSFVQQPDNFQLSDDMQNMSEKDLRAELKKQGISIPDNFSSLYAVGRKNQEELNKAFPTRVSAKTSQIDVDHALDYINKFINPNYSASDYSAARQFNMKVNDPQKGIIVSAGTAAQHLDMLKEIAHLRNNGDQQTANEIINRLATEFGSGTDNTFQAVAEQVNSEVGKVVAGGPPHEAELAEYRKRLGGSKQSDEQVDDVIKGYLGLMGGRLSETHDQYKRLLGRPLPVSSGVNSLMARYGIPTPWVEGKKGAANTPVKYTPQPNEKPVYIKGVLTGYTSDGGKTYSHKIK